MRPFTFIHAADLHLGAPFENILSLDIDEHIRKRICQSTFTAFNNLIDHCIDKNVDFLLIAGDVYNGEYQNLDAQLKFHDGLSRLSKVNILSYIVHGNHDWRGSLSKTIRFPELVTFFSDKQVKTVYFLKNKEICTAIHGMSHHKKYLQDNLSLKFHGVKNTLSAKRALKQTNLNKIYNETEVFHIGLLHCNVSGSNKEHEEYAPCTINDLIKADLHYWALGHVHTRKILLNDKPCIVYPGNIQGLHINEKGERGCSYVLVNNRGEIKSHEFLRTDDVIWYREELSINNYVYLEDLEVAFDKLTEGCAKNSDGRLSMLHLTITGRSDLHNDLRGIDSSKVLHERFLPIGLEKETPVVLTNIDIKTRKEIDFDERREADDHVGDFLKYVEEARNSHRLRKDILQELKELYDNPRAKQFLISLDENSLLKLIDRAEQYGYDLFDKGNTQ